MPWFINLAIAICFYVILNLLLKVVATKSQDPRASSLTFNTYGAVFALIIFLIDKPSLSLPSLSTTSLIVLGITTISYGLYERTHFFARKQLPSSIFTILIRLAPAITFIISTIFLHETITPYKTIGIVLIILSSFIISFRLPKHLPLPSVLLTIFCSFLLGIAWTNDKVAVSHLPVSFYNLFVWVGPTLTILIPRIKLKTIQTELLLGSWKTPLMSFCNVIGSYFLFQALSHQEASIILPLASLNSVLTVLLSIVLLKETKDLKRKLIATPVAFIGSLLLSL